MTRGCRARWPMVDGYYGSSPLAGESSGSAMPPAWPEQRGALLTRHWARREAVGRRGVALANARVMRKSPTEAERALWRLLRNKRLAGWKFRRQQPIGRYIVDFVCLEARPIVEADGSQHADNPADAARDAWLTAQSFRIARFWNNDILARSDGVLTAILAALEGDVAGIEPASSPAPLPSPPPRGGREQKDSYCG